LKSDAAQELINGVESILRNKPYFTPMVADEVLDGFLERRAGRSQYKSRALTTREREVVQLLAEGRSSKEVAALLGLSVKTAESHRANVMRKLQIHSVGELVLYAVRNQIVQTTIPLK
jgi:DNA-binding NarL/FixJ family response regulator